MKAAVQNFDAAKYNPDQIREHAMQYDKKVFKQKIRAFMEEKMAEKGARV